MPCNRRTHAPHTVFPTVFCYCLFSSLPSFSRLALPAAYMYIYICIHHIHKFICVTSVSQTIFISLSSSLTSESIWYTQTVFSFVLFLQKAYFIYIFILCTVCVFFLIYWCGQHVQHVSLAAVIFRSTGIVTSQCRRTDYPKYSSFIYKHICNARLATVMPLVPLTTIIVLLSIYINSLTFCIS